MIAVRDILIWAEDHAIGKSSSYPKGWIRGDDLMQLAQAVKDKEPLGLYYRTKGEERVSQA